MEGDGKGREEKGERGGEEGQTKGKESKEGGGRKGSSRREQGEENRGGREMTGFPAAVHVLCLQCMSALNGTK